MFDAERGLANGPVTTPWLPKESSCYKLVAQQHEDFGPRSTLPLARSKMTAPSNAASWMNRSWMIPMVATSANGLRDSLIGLNQAVRLVGEQAQYT